MASDIPKLPRCKADDDNMEKLHQAARRGQTELVRRLVASGIPANIPNKFGCTALHLACKNGHVNTVKELSKGNLSGTWHGRRPLHLAVTAGHKDVILALIEASKAQGLSLDSLINECDEYEIQEIGKHRKVCAGQTALHWAVGLQNRDMVTLLLSLGASVMSRDRSGESPLHRIIEFGDDEMFDLLMATHPTRFDTTDKHGRTVLHYSLLYQRYNMSLKLLGAGCDVNVEDAERVTPVLLAAQYANVKLLQLMLPHADPEAYLQYTIHNGKDVVEDRIGFLAGTAEERAETIKELQNKLDLCLRDRGDSNKGRKAQPILHLAPSAPIKK